MYTPHTYPVALLMMLVSMLCWGSWANTEKIDKTWRFELYYWDYMWGIVACALLFGLTLGRTNPAAPVSFFHNLDSASARSLAEAFAGGMIFNLGNLLLVAAISVAGMAVAFPLGAGLALVIGAVLNYVISPVGNRLLLFGGILLVCAAIASNAMAYRGLSKSAKGWNERDCAESTVWRGYWTLLPLRGKSLDRRKPSRAVHRVLRFCDGRTGLQLSVKLCVHATPRERIAAFAPGLFPRRPGSSCLGSFGRSHLGNRDHLQFCCGLYADGGAGHFVFARRGQHDDFRGLGCFRVERISRRQQSR